MTEAQLQNSVKKWLDEQGYLYCHVPNGGKRGKRTAAQLKNQGVKPGVPDILIFEDWQQNSGPSAAFVGHGVAIELKVGSNKTSAEQDTWLDSLESKGWLTFVCYSLDEVKRACENIR